MMDMTLEQGELGRVAAASPGAICALRVSSSGVLSMPLMNHACEQLFGLVAAHVARDASCLLALAHPEDRKGLAAAMRASRDTLQDMRHEWRHQHPVRGEIWVELYARPNRDREDGTLWCGAATDVTERKRAALALSQSDQNFRQIAETINHVFWVLDLLPEPPRVPYVSPAFERIWERRSEEIYRDPRVWLESIHPDDRERVIEAHDRWADDADHRNYAEEYRIVTPSGAVRWIFDRGRVFRNAEGVVHRVTGIAEDITERKTYEAEIQRLNRDLEARVALRTAELEASNRALEAFSYSVSHDLRAPLRAMDGFSQALVEDFESELPAEARRYLGVIRTGAQRMGKMIDDLLALARLGRKPVQRSSVDMHALVEECIRELSALEPGRKVEWQVQALPCVAGDADLLRHVWINLLSNALKYSRIRPVAHISVGTTGTDEPRTFFVRDDGTGFDMAYAHKLFGVFQRLHHEEQFEGTGVGLAIVQRIIEKHGGRVWAEAEPDRGATFYFALSEPGQAS